MQYCFNAQNTRCLWCGGTNTLEQSNAQRLRLARGEGRTKTPFEQNLQNNSMCRKGNLCVVPRECGHETQSSPQNNMTFPCAQQLHEEAVDENEAANLGHLMQGIHQDKGN